MEAGRGGAGRCGLEWGQGRAPRGGDRAERGTVGWGGGVGGGWGGGWVGGGGGGGFGVGGGVGGGWVGGGGVSVRAVRSAGAVLRQVSGGSP